MGKTINRKINPMAMAGNGLSVDELIRKFPNSQVGQEARQTLGRRAFETAMNLSSDAEKIKALEAMLISPIYAGTPVHETVQHELARLHGARKSR